MSDSWWGDHTIPEGGSARWELAHLRLWVTRTAREWLVAWRHDTGAETDTPLFEMVDTLPDDVTLHRHVFVNAPPKVSITPTLAPRPIISRPLSPVHLPARQSTTFYVGSPLWIRVEVGTPAVTLLEAPTSPLPDTWFGPNTVDGELCYADRTAARVEADDIPFRPFRAVTPVEMKNNDETSLTFDRVIAPVPQLALYRGTGDRLWTTRVHMERNTQQGSLSFTFAHDAPREATGGKRIAPPRIASSGNVVNRALNAFFS